LATLISPPPEHDADLAARKTQTVIRLSTLPSFHPAALKLLNIASDSDTAIDDFEAIFKIDPALTADLLLVANSPLFGTRASIGSIRHALTHLGLERVRSLATTIALSFFVRNQPRASFVRNIWAHSIATATVAEVLGRLYRLPELYTAGLVHDLGRLGLLLTIGETYEEWALTKVPGMEESNQSEKECFGMNHCEAASHVAENWGFPAVLQKSMIGHHDPDIGPPGAPVPLVQLACRMATAIGFPEVCLESAPFPELADKARGCEELALERIRKSVDAQMEGFGR
jgi:HD-like signal output (HDOD) protein